jgi:hypothetical protein
MGELFCWHPCSGSDSALIHDLNGSGAANAFDLLHCPVLDYLYKSDD